MKQLFRIILAGMMVYTSAAYANAFAIDLAKVKIESSQEAINKGARTVVNVCNGCHVLNFIKYQDLLAVGFTNGEIDVLRGDQRMDQHLKALTPPEVSKSLYGNVPPDLSIIAKSREGGGRYVYTLLTSFAKKEDGTVDNLFFPGIRMPDILGFADITDDKEKEKVKNDIKNVAAFLEWASDPKAKERRLHGYFVLLYFFILTVLLYFLKKRVWARLPK